MLPELPDQAHDHDPSAGQHPQGQHLPASQEAAPGDPKVVELLEPSVAFAVEYEYRPELWLRFGVSFSTLAGAVAERKHFSLPVRIVRETITREVIE